MTTFLNTVDRVALALTGLGGFGLAFAATEFLPAPPAALAAGALVAGLVLCVVVKASRVRRLASDPFVLAAPTFEEFEGIRALSEHAKHPGNSPHDPTVVGSIAWNSVGPGASIGR